MGDTNIPSPDLCHLPKRSKSESSFLQNLSEKCCSKGVGYRAKVDDVSELQHFCRIDEVLTLAILPMSCMFFITSGKEVMFRF